MKKIFIAILLFVSAGSIAQEYYYIPGSTKRNAGVIRNWLKIDSALILPADTLASAPIGSLARKNDSIYLKATSGIWIRTGGSGGGGGGSQTFQQVLTTGSTMTQANNVAQAGYKFRFTGGLVTIDSLLAGNPVGTHGGSAKNEMQGTTYIESLVGSTVTSAINFNTNYSAGGAMRMTTGASDLTLSGFAWTGATPNGTQYLSFGQNEALHRGVGDNSFGGWSLLGDTRGGVPSLRFFTKTPGSATSIVSWGVVNTGEFMVGSHTLVGTQKFQSTGGIYASGLQGSGTPLNILARRSDSVVMSITSVPVGLGGTGLTATTVGGILLGTSTTAFTNLAIGANNYVLTSNGTTASWQPAAGGSNTVPNGMTGFTSTTAYGVLTGGTTSTGNLQNAGAGTAGQIFISGGASALPAWTTKNYINADGNTSATAASIFTLGSHHFTINKSSTGDFKITGLEYGTSGELIGIDASGVVKKFKTQLLDSVDVNTTDATPVTVYTVIPDAGSQQMITVHVEFNSFKLGAAGGYYAKKKMTFTWDGGSTTLVNGTITDEAPEEFFTGLAGCDFNITNSGDNIILTFTGVAATDIHGTAIIYITYSSIGS